MKVKIIKCSMPTWWYSVRIGEVFDVSWVEEANMYSTIAPVDMHGALGFIKKEDFEVIDKSNQ